MFQDGDTPLLWAARKSNLPMAGLLLEKGADVEAKDRVSDVIPAM